MENAITVALAIDASYVPHLGVTIASVARSGPRERYNFLIMQSGLTDRHKARIASCAPLSSFRWIDVDDPVILRLQGRDHIKGPATFFRLMLPEIGAESLDRVLYLDADLVVLRSLRELWDTDLGGCPIGACYDGFVDGRAFGQRWNLPEGSGNGYFNAGVLLIDIAAIRRDGQFRRAREFILTEGSRLPYSDQDALNFVLWGQWHRLDPIWNVQRNMLICPPPDNVPNPYSNARRPAIVHYTTEHKPWLTESYHPYAWLYWKIANSTVFRDELRDLSGMTRIRQFRLLARYVKRWPHFAGAT